MDDMLSFLRWRENQWESCKTKQRLDGQVAIITGATSGLGKVLAEDLINRGATVVLACRNLVAANEVIAEIRQNFPDAKLVIQEIFILNLTHLRLLITVVFND